MNSETTGDPDKEILFTSSDKEVELGGTVKLPEGTIHAAAVLLPVAGPTDRDLSLGPHAFFKDLSQKLAERGIATLRYDDRGVGKSGGNLLQTSLSTRSEDACKALDALKTQLAPDAILTGFIGLSEGGGVGVRAASVCSSIDFAALLSTPILKGQEVMLSQSNRMIKQSPIPEKQKNEVKKTVDRFLELLNSEDPESKRQELLSIFENPIGQMILPPYAFVPTSPVEKVDFVLSPWYQSQLNYDIQDQLSASKYPILAIYGELDWVIQADRHAERLKELNPAAEIIKRKGLNHLLQEAKTGSPLEYPVLPEAFSDRVVNELTEWILTLEQAALRKHKK